jgi:hypothetical protein
MSDNKFTIILKGDEADASLRLGDLIAQLDALKLILNHLDKRISGRKSPGLYYRVTNLSMNSPTTIEMEAVAKDQENNYGNAVVNRLGRDLQDVIANRRPAEADLDLMEAYKGLVSPMKRHLAEFIFQSDNGEIAIPKTLDARVDAILGPDQMEFGSIVGSLEVIDVHQQKNLFKIYPMVGASSIKCHFQNDLLPKALSGLGSFVRISGELHCKKSEKYPHFMQVHALEILPEYSGAPLLSSLRGMARQAFGGLPAEEYVERVRNESW